MGVISFQEVVLLVSGVNTVTLVGCLWLHSNVVTWCGIWYIIVHSQASNSLEMA